MQSINPGHDGPTTLNGTTSVSICAAPGEDTRKQVLKIRVRNADTKSITAILERDVDGVKTEIARVPVIPPGVTDMSLVSREDPIHLVGELQSLTMKLAAAPETNQPIVEVESMVSTD